MVHLNTTLSARADEWLCTKEVARLTGLSASFFEQARSRKRPDGPPWHKIGGRVRYRLSEIVARLESCRVTGRNRHG